MIVKIIHQGSGIGIEIDSMLLFISSGLFRLKIGAVAMAVQL